MTTFEPWEYRSSTEFLAGTDLTDYTIAAEDGDIGRVDSASYEVGSAYLVVDTGPWIFGRKVMLPAGVVERIDTEERKVYVDRTKEQIKDAPDYDEMLRNNPEYRETLGGYYSGTYERPGFGI
jgi:hypothetical protein